MIKKHILELEHSNFLYQDGNQTHFFRIPAPTVPTSVVLVSTVPKLEFEIPAQDFWIPALESIFLGNRISKCQTTWI